MVECDSIIFCKGLKIDCDEVASFKCVDNNVILYDASGVNIVAQIPCDNLKDQVEIAQMFEYEIKNRKKTFEMAAQLMARHFPNSNYYKCQDYKICISLLDIVAIRCFEALYKIEITYKTGKETFVFNTSLRTTNVYNDIVSLLN